MVLKKKFIVFIPLVVLLFSIIFYTFFYKHLDVNKIDKDCDFLSKIFTEASVDIAQTIDEGLDIKELIARIKKEYARQVKRHKRSMSVNENGIADNRFAMSISKVLKEELTRPNGHLYINSPYEMFYPFTSYVFFASDLLFEKEDSKYKVYKTNNNQIKEGMLYTGSEENLFKTIIDDKILYRFGYYSNEWLTHGKANIEGKDYRIKLNLNNKAEAEVQNFSLKTEGKVLTVKANSFMWHTEAEKNKILETITTIGKTLGEEDIELIVFDLRGNGGGYSTVSYLLLGTLVTGTDNENAEEFGDYIKYYNYLHSDDICINTFTSRNRISLEGRGDSNLTRYLLENTGEKYTVLTNPEAEYLETITPLYKGKIIFLSDVSTGSGAEDFILAAKSVFKDKVTILGHSSRGALDYANVFQFKLPDSKLSMLISFTDSTKAPVIKNSTCWQGDAKGVLPDYWFTFEDDFDLAKLVNFITEDF